MKIVRKDVCHVWAHQTQEQARWENVSFSGDTIRSYAAPIARHVTGKNGVKCVLFTTSTYSVTTAKHCGEIRRSIPSGVPVFNVDSPKNKPSASDVKGYAARIHAAEVAMAKSTKPAVRLLELQAIVNEANAFCEMFGFKARFAVTADVSALKEQLKAQAIKDEAKRKRDSAKAIRDAKEKLAQWLAGESVPVPQLPTDYLRIVGDDVETTRHAIVPVAHVKRVAKLILRKANAGEAWHSNGETIRVGQYQLDSIDADGTVNIGCHHFEKSEIERIAALLA